MQSEQKHAINVEKITTSPGSANPVIDQDTVVKTEVDMQTRISIDHSKQRQGRYNSISRYFNNESKELIMILVRKYYIIIMFVKYIRSL